MNENSDEDPVVRVFRKRTYYGSETTNSANTDVSGMSDVSVKSRLSRLSDEIYLNPEWDENEREIYFEKVARLECDEGLEPMRAGKIARKLVDDILWMRKYDDVT